MSWIAIEVDGKVHRVAAARGRDGIWISIGGRSAFYPDPRRQSTGPGSAAIHDEIRAPMTGKVVAVHVQVGEAVTEGTLLAILEAMKMEYRLVAPRAGLVEAVHCRAGDLVDLGLPLVRLMESASDPSITGSTTESPQ
jgi:biotin carboxyl carrier protein